MLLFTSGGGDASLGGGICTGGIEIYNPHPTPDIVLDLRVWRGLAYKLRRPVLVLARYALCEAHA